MRPSSWKSQQDRPKKTKKKNKNIRGSSRNAIISIMHVRPLSAGSTLSPSVRLRHLDAGMWRFWGGVGCVVEVVIRYYFKRMRT